MEEIKIRVLDNPDKSEWDKRLDMSPQGTFYQSSVHADFFERFYCYEPVYTLAEDCRGQIKGSLLFFKAPVSTKAISLFPFKKTAAILLKKMNKAMITWKGGPVVYQEAKYSRILNEFLNFLEVFLGKNGLKTIKFSSLPLYGVTPVEFSSAESVFRNNAYNAAEKSTILIDLSISLEGLWRALKQGSRYDVEKAKKSGMNILISSKAEDLLKYHAGYSKACFRNKVMPYPKEMLSFLLNRGGKLFIALYKDAPIAGSLCVEYNKRVDQRYLWNSKYAVENKLFAMHLITWSMIEYYKNRGCCFLDLVGVNTKEGRSAKEDGILRFKRRWGGKIVSFLEFSKNFKQ